MSLTSLVRQKTPVRERMALDFPRSKLSLDAELRVPSVAPNPALMGIAFDYLLRFHLQRQHRFAVPRSWVAESAHSEISAYGDTGMALLAGDDYILSGVVRDAMARYIRRAKGLLAQFIAGAPLSRDLIRAAINLAHCDPFYRALRIDERFGKPLATQVDELRRLIEAVDWSLFAARRVCLLNPAFGKGSSMVGGADADLLLDDMLIDIKTTATLKLRTEDWRQLIGYAALNEYFPIGGGSDPVRIRRIGIYFARHGYLTSWPLAELVDQDRFTAFAAWLRDYAQAAHAERLQRHKEFEEWVQKEKQRGQRTRARRAKPDKTTAGSAIDNAARRKVTSRARSIAKKGKRRR